MDAGPLYHVALTSDWVEGQADGRYAMSTRGRSLEEEGFIHCSFAEQVEATANLFYADVEELVLLRIDPGRLGCPVVVEQGFPHIYGAIDPDAVVEVWPWPRSADGSRSFAAMSPRV